VKQVETCLSGAGVCFSHLWSPKCVQHLEFLAKMGRVQELHQGKFALTHSKGFLCRNRGDGLACISNEE
jgi:hypothetical protein